jgi:hypothetical protein
MRTGFSARRSKLGGALGSVSPAGPAQPSFFWPAATQHVTRILAAIPLRDVSAAVAGAGAFALWALALSLLAA